MKKIITICALAMVSTLIVMAARTLYVEKAVNVSARIDNKDTAVKAGSTLDENTKITIPDDGVLIVVDKTNGKRWLIKKKYKGNVGKVAKEKDKDIVTTSKSFFYTYSKPRESTKNSKSKKAGVSVIGGGVGGGDSSLLGLIGVDGSKNLWENDSTYQFLDEIETDSISYILVE